MVITFAIKFLVLLLIHGVILPCPVKCYSAKFFNDNSDFYKKYFMKHYNSNYKLPFDYQYYHDIKNIDNFPIPELLFKTTDDHDKYGEGIEINEVINEPLESEAVKRSLLGNKRNNSLKLKLLNQGARGFGRK
uniref:Uncharacterized protein n=1 Tax=Strongyloides venezuelensis TaxID=75913 RepID=A0A0K0FYJ6_STRVS